VRISSRHDGFEFGVFHAPAQGERRGGLVLLHEVWGVTPGIERLCQGFAADGYEVIAPQLFDRRERDYAVERNDENAVVALRHVAETPHDQALGDVLACAAMLAPPVFAVGFCYGGTVAWLTACRSDALTGAAVFYSNGVSSLVEEQPRCPIIFHYGNRDPHIGLEHHTRIKAAQPDLPFYVYDAGHGFFSDDRPEAEPEAAALSRTRTLEFFDAARKAA
jgi:carboxymethylenebutenolidase